MEVRYRWIREKDKFFWIFLTMILLTGALNGIMDNIDHHKGMAALRDIWHLVKHLDRLALIGVGIMGLRFRWSGRKVLLMIAVVILSKFVWDYFYTHQVEFWYRLDETVNFPSLGKFLDDLLGFDK